MNNEALIVLDFINDIVDADGKVSGSAAYIKENNIIDNVNLLIKFARQNRMLIIFVKVAFKNDYSDCSETSPIFSQIKAKEALQLNTWGTEFQQDLAVEKNDIVIIKHRISAFYQTNLDDILRQNHIQTLIVAGVSSDMAVQSVAREGHDRDYKILIAEDACAAQNKAIHDASMQQLSRIATVKKTEYFAKIHDDK